MCVNIHNNYITKIIPNLVDKQQPLNIFFKADKYECFENIYIIKTPCKFSFFEESNKYECVVIDALLSKTPK